MPFVSYLPFDCLQMIVGLEINGERSLKGKVHSGLEYRTIERRLFEVSFVQRALFANKANITYIAGFLVHFESELLKRAHKNFTFVNGRCVGQAHLFTLYYQFVNIWSVWETIYYPQRKDFFDPFHLP